MVLRFVWWSKNHELSQGREGPPEHPRRGCMNKANPLESMSQRQVKVQGIFRNGSIRNLQPLNLFQVWQNEDSMIRLAGELKMPELPKEDSGMEWE